MDPPASAAEASASARRLVLRIGVPVPHIEQNPHFDDSSADPVQVESLAVGPEARGYETALAPLALLPTRDLGALSLLARFPQFPPRPPPPGSC